MAANHTTTGKDETLRVTLTTASGQVLDWQIALDPPDAVKCALRILSRRPFLNAGDTLTIRKPNNGGEIHRPRELD